MGSTPSDPPASERATRDEDDADAVIVGAGYSGVITAITLAKAGYRVVVLERGDWPDYSTARATAPDFEMGPGRNWIADPNVRQLPGDQAIDDTSSDISAVILNGVGGSAVNYAGQWHRNMPSDFRTRSLDGVGDDWPMTYEDLNPFYQRLERMVGVSGLNGDPAFPGTEYPMPAVRMREWGRRVARAHDELSWHWWPGSNAIATRDYGPLTQTTELGAEMWGSPDRSKSTPDVMLWPTALELGVELRRRSSATEIEVGANGLATGVLYRDESGAERRQKAKLVVLAANGIGTPWLLLNSASARFPDGLANSSGLVGKRLMMHPLSTVVGIFDDPLESWQGDWGQQLYSMQFYETDESRGFVRGAKWTLMPSGGPVATTQEYPWGKPDFWGKDFHSTVQRRMGHAATWGIISEDLPMESNSVSLSDAVRDEYGYRVPKLTYTASDNSERLLRWHEARASESLLTAGATAVSVAPAIRATGWHLLGTAVMGSDRATSVVDGYGRTHDIENLYVFDGSTWPTSSGTNPTATIAALALRNSEHLVARRADQRSAS